MATPEFMCLKDLEMQVWSEGELDNEPAQGPQEAEELQSFMLKKRGAEREEK